MTEPDLVQIQEEMAADPILRPVLNKAIDDYLVRFLEEAIKFGRQMQLEPDPRRAQRILVDAEIWMREANRQMTKGRVIDNKPSSTPEAFVR